MSGWDLSRRAWYGLGMVGVSPSECSLPERGRALFQQAEKSMVAPASVLSGEMLGRWEFGLLWTRWRLYEPCPCGSEDFLLPWLPWEGSLPLAQVCASGTGMRKQARSSSLPFMWGMLGGWTWRRGIALQESAQGSPCQTQVGDPSALLILGYIPSAFSFIQSVSAPIVLGNGLMIVLESIFYYRYKNRGYVFVDLIIFTDNSMVLYKGDKTLGKEMMMLHVFFLLGFFLNFTSWEARNARKLWANKNICCIYSRIQISAGMKFNVKKFVLQYEVKWSLWCLVRECWNTTQTVASFQSVLHMLKVLQTRP